MTPKLTWSGLLWVSIIYGLLTVLLMQFHGYQINFGEWYDQREQRHSRLVNNEGDTPWAFRIIVPMAAEQMRNELAASDLLTRAQAREFSYLLLRFGFTVGFLLLFHIYLTRWVSPAWAMVGGMWMIALQGLSYINYWYQPASALDLLLWLAAVELTLRRQDRWLIPLLIVGTLNRETAIFMIALHAGARYGDEPLADLASRCQVLVGFWAAVYLGLRTYIHPVGTANRPVIKHIQDNLNGEWLGYAFFFVSPMMVMPTLSPRKVPAVLWRIALALVPYLLLVLVFGRVREVRLLLPLAIPFIPASLILLRDQLEPDAQGG
ncbi:MAG: hypothetical protein AAFV53_20305 [Myxococcota bacterium]